MNNNAPTYSLTQAAQFTQKAPYLIHAFYNDLWEAVWHYPDVAEFLGHIIFKDGSRITRKEVKAIEQNYERLVSECWTPFTDDGPTLDIAVKGWEPGETWTINVNYATGDVTAHRDGATHNEGNFPTVGAALEWILGDDAIG